MNYTDQDRMVFSYHDGETTVYIDPLAAYRKIMVMTRGKPNQLQESMMARLEAPDPKLMETAPQAYLAMENEYASKLQAAAEAAELLENVVRSIFQMKPFDRMTGKGADAYLCLKVWKDFARFMAQKKTKHESEPTPSTPTDGPTDTIPATPSISD